MEKSENHDENDGEDVQFKPVDNSADEPAYSRKPKRPVKRIVKKRKAKNEQPEQTEEKADASENYKINTKQLYENIAKRRAEVEKVRNELYKSLSEKQKEYDSKIAKTQEKAGKKAGSLEATADMSALEQEFNKESYKKMTAIVPALTELMKKYDSYKAKKMAPKDISELRQQLVDIVNSFLPPSARYTPKEIAKYEEANAQEELMQNLGADLADILYDPKLSVQRDYVSKLPDYLSDEFREFTKNKKKIAGEQLYDYFFQPMTKALEKSGLKVAEADVPRTIEKCLVTDRNGTEKSEEYRKEIIKEVVSNEINECYGKDANPRAADIAKYFTEKSYQRRFKFLKDSILGHYLKMHSDDLHTYVVNGAKAMASIEGSDAIDSGKKRLEAVTNYMDTYSKYSQHMSLIAQQDALQGEA